MKFKKFVVGKTEVKAFEKDQKQMGTNIAIYNLFVDLFHDVGKQFGIDRRVSREIRERLTDVKY